MNIIKIILLAGVGLYVLIALIFYFFQELFIFLPEKLEEDYQFEFPFEFEEKNFTMKDGAVLNAIHAKAQNSKGIIFYNHGNAGNMVRWGEVITPFVDQGYEVLLYDFRGYGKSSGKRTMSKLYNDAQFIYDELTEEYGEDKVIVYGRSLGTGLASWIGGHNKPKQVILETPYFSLGDVAKRYYPFLPTRPILKFPFASHVHLRKASSPVFIFHGTEDEVVPYNSGQKLYESLSGKIDISFYTIPGGKHNNLSEFEEFSSQLEKILLQ